MFFVFFGVPQHQNWWVPRVLAYAYFCRLVGGYPWPQNIVSRDDVAFEYPDPPWSAPGLVGTRDSFNLMAFGHKQLLGHPVANRIPCDSGILWHLVTTNCGSLRRQNSLRVYEDGHAMTMELPTNDHYIFVNGICDVSCTHCGL